MTHETAPQRRRRHKADPYRAQILAPKPVDMPRVLCAREGCGHPRLIHDECEDFLGDVKWWADCRRVGCTCTEYVEESE